MKPKINTITEKITLLNQTILDSMVEKSDKEIIKNFTEVSIKILNADFSFAWWKFKGSEEYKLAYKSPTTPYNPFLPRKKASHYKALKTKEPFFDSDVRKGNYGTSDISPYMKSFVIIPICYGNYIYGTITLCYKKRHDFTEDELTLAHAVGSTTAQAITVHRFVETDILLAQEKLKAEFIANATHELRTPLAIIKGNVDLALMNKKVSLTSAMNALTEVDSEIDRLSYILADLQLLTSKDKSVALVASQKPIEITNLINNSVKRLRTIANEKKITIRIKVRKIVDLFVLGEEKYLDKLFLNVIRNAITYGKRGGKIQIEIQKEKNKVKIEISDNGVGISPGDLPRVFERFYRADKAHTNAEDGNHSGLGLAIAKLVAETHGGSIRAKSTPGKGSTFTITLPTIYE